MAKSIQGLPIHIADGACLAMLGWVSVEAWIDRRRLMFLWSILNLSMDNIYKECVLTRLCKLRNWTGDLQPKGPVSKMYETCHKYGLHDILHMMMDTGVIINKSEWKREISKHIMEREHNIWWCSIHLYASLGIYRAVVPGISLCWWWSLANDFPNVRQYCRSVVRVIMGGCVWFGAVKENNEDVCIVCRSEKDSVEHFLYACTALNRERLDLINEASLYVESNLYESLNMEEKWALLLSNGSNLYESLNMEEKWVLLLSNGGYEASLYVESNLYESLNMEEKWALLLSNGGYELYSEWRQLGRCVVKAVHKMLSLKMELAKNPPNL